MTSPIARSVRGAPSLASSLFFSSLVVLAVGSATRVAHAAPGCSDGVGGGCVLSAGLGPCDDACPTGYCVGSVCMDPLACPVPCDTVGACPPLRIGNNIIDPEGSSGSTCGYGTGCGFVTASQDEGVRGPEACIHPGDVGIVAFLNGDCDGDQVPNVAEGVGQFCLDQLYTGPLASRNIPTCDPMTCGAGCASGFTPHGGMFCSSEAARAYLCSDVSMCPSTFGIRPVACLHPVVGGTTRPGLCLYTGLCQSDVGGCFDFAAADSSMWIESAYAAGDCDDDGILNRDDAADCGPQLVVWPDARPFVDRGAMACGTGSLCGVSGECSRLGLCARPGSIGLACEPGSPDAVSFCSLALGVGAECVYAGPSSDMAAGVCIPADPRDGTCLLRGTECFARGGGIDPADSYHLGDCDGDGLINGEDDDVCTPFVPDAGSVNADGGNATTEDAGNAEADAGSGGELDAALEPGIDAGTPGRFAGSGCSCRAARSSGPSTALGLALVALATWAHARRTRRRR